MIWIVFDRVRTEFREDREFFFIVHFGTQRRLSLSLSTTLSLYSL